MSDSTVRSARDRLDQHVREIVHWHFDPSTGCPFWLERAKQFTFDPYEPIHVEYSFKYLTDDIHGLARETGYRVVRDFTDDRGWFVDSLWRVLRDPVQPSSSG